MTDILQFGNPSGTYPSKLSAYAVIAHDGKLLCLLVRGKYHLPGGGRDGNENAAEAVKREVLEEAGYSVLTLEPIGEANQFFEMTREGHPLNKLGTFFKATVDLVSMKESVESDHEIRWILVEDFLNSTAADFQKWAVRQAVY